MSADLEAPHNELKSFSEIFKINVNYDGVVQTLFESAQKEANLQKARCFFLHAWNNTSQVNTNAAHARVADALRGAIARVWPQFLHNASVSMPATDVADLNRPHPESGATLLMLVCRNAGERKFGKLIQPSRLVELGADPLIFDSSGTAAVQYYVRAIQNCSIKVVKTLLPEMKNCSMHVNYLLHSAACSLNSKVISLCLQRGASPWSVDQAGRLPIDYLWWRASQPKSRQVFQQLFAAMRKTDRKLQEPKRQGNEGMTLLHLAVCFGDKVAIAALLKICPKLAAAKNESHQWPVHLAILRESASEDEVLPLLCAALQHSSPEDWAVDTSDLSILIPLLQQSLKRNFNEVIEKLLELQDVTMLSFQTGWPQRSLLVCCETEEQFIQLFPHVRAANVDVSDAFVIAASHRWKRATNFTLQQGIETLLVDAALVSKKHSIFHCSVESTELADALENSSPTKNELNHKFQTPNTFHAICTL